MMPWLIRRLLTFVAKGLAGLFAHHGERSVGQPELVATESRERLSTLLNVSGGALGRGMVVAGLFEDSAQSFDGRK